MIFLIIGAILGTFAFYAIEGWFSAFLGSAVGGILGAMVASIVCLIIWPTHWETNTYSLNNIADNSTLHGSFFLGSGSVNGVPTYSYYQQTEQNSYVRQDVDASDATIHYTNKKPYVVEHQEVGNGGAIHWFYIDMGSNSTYKVHYDFYVPKGSIVSTYRLDAK